MTTHEKTNGNAQTTSGGTPEGRPLWQQISGIDPQRENEMDADARDAALRKLIKEVEKRATVEFERADAGKIPEGERTLFWDPLARICGQLGISRTKLSTYSRELTGMRAHEISDRILAKRKLAERLAAWVKDFAGRELELARDMFSKAHIDDDFRSSWMKRLAKGMKSKRQGDSRAHFAAQMGFANYSRLSRACLLAFGKSLDHLESELVCAQVQKFFDAMMTEKNQPPRRQERQEQPKKAGGSLSPEGEEIVREAIAETLGIKKEDVRVA